MKANIGCPVVGRTAGCRSVYGHVITKFSGMGRFTKLWGCANARAWSSANTNNKKMIFWDLHGVGVVMEG